MFCSHKVKPYEEVTELLPFENNWILGGEMDGISVLSIYQFQADWSEEKYLKIKQQIHEIYSLNQFLLGKIKKVKGKWVLVTNSQLANNSDALTSKIDKQHIFEKVVDPNLLTTDGDFREKCKIWSEKCQQKIKSMYQDDTGEYNNLSNFLILSDAEKISEATKIGIVYNQQHMIGDGCTAYLVMNMLNQDQSNLKTKLRSLDRVSVPHDKELSEFTSIGCKDPKKNIILEMEKAKFMACLGKAWKRKNNPDRAMKFWIKKMDMGYIEAKKMDYQKSRSSKHTLLF